MKFVQHPQHTRSLGAPPGWDHSKVHCGSLSIKDTNVAGCATMESCWTPEGAEAMTLALGLADIRLAVFGRVHPPVSLIVYPNSAAYSDRQALEQKLTAAMRDLMQIAESNGFKLLPRGPHPITGSYFHDTQAD